MWAARQIARSWKRNAAGARSMMCGFASACAVKYSGNACRAEEVAPFDSSKSSSSFEGPLKETRSPTIGVDTTLRKIVACALESVVRTDPGPYQKTAFEYGCQGPNEWHPAFYGCWDWHSAVHTHFLLVRCLKRHKVDKSMAASAMQILQQHLSDDNIAVEVASMEREKHGWECPYGLSWVLRLALELDGWNEELSRALQPLERVAVMRLTSWLEDTLANPDRSGSHGNCAFALRLIWLHSRKRMDGVPEPLVYAAYHALTGLDTPDPCAPGHPFLSPLLIELQLGLTLCEDLSLDWHLSQQNVKKLLDLTPQNGNPNDIRTCHALGLNFSRAQGLAELAVACSDRSASEELLKLAKTHFLASAPYLHSGGWMGDHWICTFALLALEACTHADGLVNERRSV
eukprot:TRINITY_DN46365_c0_g1_i1.p1 TRINITY_DN46365_c0_g1~~TRINITY_DN46365_c0_g1_i1.p1  ORF type:complete len:402 (+),score=34.62 TRINITY_DN46365_c0_g1_i1:124-1329(+)